MYSANLWLDFLVFKKKEEEVQAHVHTPPLLS